MAFAAAERARASYGDGTWFVGLASLSNPDLVPSAIGAALGAPLSGSDHTRTLGAWLRDRNALLVLDNCEHVIGAAAALAEALLKAAPRADIVATSREPLRAEGEWLHRLAPLELPPPARTLPTAAEALGYSAVELFNERAIAKADSLVLDDPDVPAVLEICRRLDGVPLALELAAARVDTFGVGGLAARLDDRFGILTSGRRTALPRQQTLRATIDWSYDLLPELETLLLRRLAMFPSGFTLTSAAAVMDESVAALDLFNGISNLVTKSLVNFDRSEGSNRWKLLETIRAYALEKLDESGERDRIACRCAEYYRDLFERAEAEQEARPTAQWLGEYGWQIDNLRSALDWAFSPGGNASISAALTAASVPLWMHLALVAECRERCDRALLKLQTNHIPDLRLRMRLQIGLGNSLLHTRGPSEQAETVLTEALESAEALDDMRAQLRILLDLASVIGFRGEYARAAAASERAGAIAQQIGDTTGAVFADRRMGMILLRLGRLQEAQRYFERVIQSPPSYRNEDHSGERAIARALLARTLWPRGFPEKAQHEAQASLGELGGSDDQLTMCRVLLYGMGRIAPMTGDFSAAEAAISSIIETATSAAAPFWNMVGQFLRGKLLVERHQCAEGLAVLREAFGICDQTGWRLSYPEFMGSLALALAGVKRLDEAHDAVCKAIEAAGGHQDGDQWYVPELLRIKGEVLLRQSSNQALQAAEACFDQAARMAREQGALSWELRIALSVARLRVAQGRHAEATQTMAPV